MNSKSNDKSFEEELDLALAAFEIWCDEDGNSPEEVQRFADESDFREEIIESLLAIIQKENQFRWSQQSNAPSQQIGRPTSPLRYVVEDKHAEGGLGVIYRAWDSELDERIVAIKKIAEHRSHSPAIQERFLYEANITAKLSHPGVAPVYSLGWDRDQPFYAMKLIDGLTLQQAIQNAHASDRNLLKRFVDVCLTISFAHHQTPPVIHRDIKPSNIILGEYGETVVIYWGLAKQLSDSEVNDHASNAVGLTSGKPNSSIEGSTMGTPQFMVPEQASGDWNNVSESSDVYSLGAVLVNIATGQPPVHGDQKDEVLEKVKLGDIATSGTRPSQVPKPLWSICKKAMAFRQEDRYSDVDELCRDIGRFLDHQKVDAHRESVPEWISRWLRDHPKTTLAIAMTGLFLSIGLVILGIYNQKLDDVRQAANDNFIAARQAIDKYMVLVTEDKRLKEDDFFDLRKSLLESAVPLYERLRNQRPKDGSVDFGQADATFRLARLEDEIGDKRSAAIHFQESINLLIDLIQNSPKERGYRVQLARSHNNLGLIYSDRQDYEKADKSLLTALSVKQELDADFPDDPEILDYLASAFHNLGQLNEKKGEVEAAEEYFVAAVNTQQKLCETSLQAKYKSNLVKTLNVYGTFVESNGDITAAQVLFKEAERYQRELLKADPLSPILKADLAMTLGNLGSTFTKMEKFEQATKLLREACSIGKELSDLFPNHRSHQMSYSRALVSFGSMLFDQGEYEQAREQFSSSLQIQKQLRAKDPENIELKVAMAIHHFNLGNVDSRTEKIEGAIQRYRQAEEIFRELAELHPKTYEHRRKLSGCHAQIGLSLAKLNRLPEAIDSLKLAIELLRKVYEQTKFVGHAAELVGYRESYCSLLFTANQQEPASLELVEIIRLLEQVVAKVPEESLYLLRLGGSYCNQGNLYRQNQPEIALAWYEKAIETLKPLAENGAYPDDYRSFMENVCFGKARALDALNRYVEAAASWKQASEFSDDAKEDFEEAARSSARCAKYAKEFELILESENILSELANRDGQFIVEFSEYCTTKGKQLYYTAAKGYELAFEKSPGLADPVKMDNRQFATTAAILAANGIGKDSDLVTPVNGKELRQQAFMWLSADFEFYQEIVADSDYRTSLFVVQGWLNNPEFDSVRNPDLMQNLSEDEREQWSEIWAKIRKFVK